MARPAHPLTPMPVPPSESWLRDEAIKDDLVEYLVSRGLPAKKRDTRPKLLAQALAARAAHVPEFVEHTAALFEAALTTPCPQPDVPAPEHGDTTTGWDYNVHGRRVFKAWSRAMSHGTGKPPTNRYGGGSQRSRDLYSTQELALAALAHGSVHKLLGELGSLARYAEREAWLLGEVRAYLRRMDAQSDRPAPRPDQELRVVDADAGRVVVSWGERGNYSAHRYDVAAAGDPYVWLLGFAIGEPSRDAAERVALTMEAA